MKILMNKVEVQYSMAYSTESVQDEILGTHCVVSLWFNDSRPLEFFTSLTKDERETFLQLSDQIRSRILNEIKESAHSGSKIR